MNIDTYIHTAIAAIAAETDAKSTRALPSVDVTH